MPVIATSIFLILAGMGFGSLVISTLTKFGVFFAAIGTVAFFTISLMLFSNFDVVSTTTYVDSTTQWNETSYLLGGENDDSEEVQPKIWIGWLFFTFGLVGVVVFFLELLKLGKA